MTKIYIKNGSGQKIVVEVTDEVAEQMTESRREEWRNNAKERYYRDAKLHELNEKDDEWGSDTDNPETMFVSAYEQKELRAKMIAVAKTLTARQLEVLRLLKKGKTCLEISEILGVSKQSVNDVRNAIKEKFKVFLK